MKRHEMRCIFSCCVVGVKSAQYFVCHFLTELFVTVKMSAFFVKSKATGLCNIVKICGKTQDKIVALARVKHLQSMLVNVIAMVA